MARILLYFLCGNDADVIECPQYVADNLKSYQRKFDKWIYDRKNQHGYWVKDPADGGWAVCFDGEAFLNWLNNNVLTDGDEKAFFVSRNHIPTQEEKKYPQIHF